MCDSTKWIHKVVQILESNSKPHMHKQGLQNEPWRSHVCANLQMGNLQKSRIIFASPQVVVSYDAWVEVAVIGFYLNATMQLDNWMHACIHTSPCHPLAMAKCEFGIRNENMSKSEAKANYLNHAKRRAQHVQIHPISNSYTYIHTYTDT